MNMRIICLTHIHNHYTLRATVKKCVITKCQKLRARASAKLAQLEQNFNDLKTADSFISPHPLFQPVASLLYSNWYLSQSHIHTSTHVHTHTQSNGHTLIQTHTACCCDYMHVYTWDSYTNYIINKFVCTNISTHHYKFRRQW